MDGATELLRLAHSAKWSLSDHILSTLGIATVRVGEERTVLLSDEESRSDGVHTDALAKLLGALRSHIGREIRDASLGSSIAAYAGHRAEGSHGREVDDASLASLYHRLEEYLSRDHSTGEVEV